MTNREKYAKEILDIACENEAIAVKNGVPCRCGAIECSECDLARCGSNRNDCGGKFVKWCKAECVEPPVDWSKVPIDTPILARNLGSDMWHRRHFAKYENGAVYSFGSIGTSWSNGDDVCYCECVKLATDDELNANSILRENGRKEK